jgi:hypothetical protein
VAFTAGAVRAWIADNEMPVSAGTTPLVIERPRGAA